MRVVVFSQNGPSSVLHLVERPAPEPGPGQLAVRIVRAGVNPTDWKFRERPNSIDGEVAPGKDGAGTVEAVGDGVGHVAPGDRVWVQRGQHRTGYGTAAEVTVQPASSVIPLPPGASFDVGASLGVPFVTAHRLLTSGRATRLAPGALSGQVVLVAGGAGSVGNAAIQLACWAGATVISTVSSAEKAALAHAAGAPHVVNYREGDAQAEILALAPDGVDLICEVAPAPNAALDLAVAREHATVSVYADDGGDTLALPIAATFTKNLKYQFVGLSGLDDRVVRAAAEDINAALAEGAVRVGRDAGLPLHHFALADTAAAQDAVQGGLIGKALIDVG